MQQQFRLISAGAAAHQQQFRLIAAGAAAHHLDNDSADSAGAATNQPNVIPAAASTKQPHQIDKTPAAASTKQPHQTDKASHADQTVSLLTIVQGFQTEHAAQKAQAHDRLPTTQLPSNMGELQTRLDKWEHAQHRLEEQVAFQQQTLEKAQVDQFDSKDDVAIKVWCKRKVLGCAAVSIAIMICFISAMSQNKKENKKSKSPAQLENERVPEVSKQALPSEVSKHLADLADLVGRVKMPSEGSSEVATQAMEASKLEKDANIVEEPVVSY